MAGPRDTRSSSLQKSIDDGIGWNGTGNGNGPGHALVVREQKWRPS